MHHCLGLSSNGKVYGWGNNQEGEVGSGNSSSRCINFPRAINFEFPVKFIDCNLFASFAVDVNGTAFYWGKIPFENEIVNRPRKMCENVLKIQKILFKNECIVMKESGNVFLYSFSDKTMKEIIVGEKVNDIFLNLFETDECVYLFDNKTYLAQKKQNSSIFMIINQDKKNQHSRQHM